MHEIPKYWQLVATGKVAFTVEGLKDGNVFQLTSRPLKILFGAAPAALLSALLSRGWAMLRFGAPARHRGF